MDISNFLNPVEETVQDSPEDLLDHVADTFTEIKNEGEANDNPEQHESPRITTDQALRALDALRYEENRDVPDAGLQALLLRRLKEVTNKRPRDRLDRARQQSLYNYFMSM